MLSKKTGKNPNKIKKQKKPPGALPALDISEYL